jgi:hypothetical protein
MYLHWHFDRSCCCWLLSRYVLSYLLDDEDMFINMLVRCRAVLSYMDSGPHVTDPSELQLALAEKLRGDHTTLPDFLGGLRSHLEDPTKVLALA